MKTSATQLASNKRWREANPEKMREYTQAYRRRNPNAARDTHYKTKYGLSVLGKERIITLQKGKCPGCGTHLRSTRNHIDHCHDTGRVRGVLCHKCNVAIGMASDDPLILRNLIRYLETSNAELG